MELNSVRGLKQQLTSPAVVAALTAGGAGGPAARPPFALGVSRGGNEYRLAVRIQRQSPGLDDALRLVSERAHGEVDVRWVGAIRALRPAVAAAAAPATPLRGGDSIGFLELHTGTLGVVVVDAGGQPMILSNNHVLANENRGAIGTEIIRPGSIDGGSLPEDVVARLSQFVSLVAGGVNRVDAAVAEIVDGVQFERAAIAGLGPVNGIRLQPPNDIIVRKVGRTTGLTTGRVTAFELDDVRVEMDMGILRFDDQIEIARTGSKPFSLSGDSGSLVVDSATRAVGLLFAGNDFDMTYANPIGPVLQALGVSL